MEAKWTCSGGSTTQASTCIDKCGDGYVVTPSVGYCDDGNLVNGDGCDSTCNVESKWICTLGNANTASICTDSCGDGFVTTPTAGYCDDGKYQILFRLLILS